MGDNNREALLRLLRAAFHNAGFLAFLVFVVGTLARVEYSLHVHRPQDFIASDMEIYVNLARRFASASEPLGPWDVSHPLGYPALLSYLISGGGLERAVNFQIVISSLVPPALGLLGLAAFGRQTGLLALVAGSIYFPFIEFGALFLAEIHFILALALAFAAFFAARRAQGWPASLGLAAAGGFAISIAAAMKSVALIATVAFFALDGLVVIRKPRHRLRWLTRALVAVIAALPVLTVLARTCTRANEGKFCVTGNKVGSDFLLGHYGRIADIDWEPDRGHGFRFGSPGSYLRHYEEHAKVPFHMTDNAANTAEAWRWIFAHPFDAIVFSIDHVYDAFFGASTWPSYGNPSWPGAHLSQYVFVVFLFFPTLFACLAVARRGARAFLTSRTALVLAPVAALTVTVAIATGEVRYRIPFDIFFIVVTCAFAVGELARVDDLPRNPERVPNLPR